MYSDADYSGDVICVLGVGSGLSLRLQLITSHYDATGAGLALYNLPGAPLRVYATRIDINNGLGGDMEVTPILIYFSKLSGTYFPV